MTDDNTPIWFLGIDGVINAITYACPSGFQEGRACPRGYTAGFSIKWDPRIIEQINDIHDTGLAKVMWLTTWGSEANGELADLVGINKFEVASEAPLYAEEAWDSANAAPGGWWKFSVVQKYYEENPIRRFVWTDDDLNLEKEARAWVVGKQFFIVSPLPHLSLTMNDLDNIRTFLKGPLYGA